MNFRSLGSMMWLKMLFDVCDRGGRGYDTSSRTLDSSQQRQWGPCHTADKLDPALYIISDRIS